MPNKLRKFCQLNQIDQQLLLESYLLLGAIRLGLWSLPFGRLQKILGKISPPRKLDIEVQMEQIITAVNRSSRYSPGDVKCLARALTTQVLLNKYGYSPQLRIGVAKGEQGQLEAHAWVEEQEKIVIGNLGDLDKFTVLPTLERKLL